MARSAASAVENNFKSGLITEASGMNFPENACTETYDCEFDFLGRVSRRLGFDLEVAYETETIDLTGGVITDYVWRNVAGDGETTFVVQQVGNFLYFYDSGTGSSLSSGLSASTIDLTDFSPVGADEPRLKECQFADGFGKLFVFHPNLEPFAISYDSGAGTFSGTATTVSIRDFEGLVEAPALDIDERPTASMGTISTTHNYNLLNQGWLAADLATWDTARTDLPSNADVDWTFKNASDVFDASTVPNVQRGNTPAPKGHFILNVFNQDRSTVSGVAGITAVTTGTERPSVGTFFAGRVWYAGIGYTGFNSKIYFSQIIEGDTQFGNCYQANDPTAENLFDLLPADGGVINIPEAGTVYKLFPMQAALLVFAHRGVWAITGSQGVGFSAVDYTVSKISDYRTISGTSFVEVNGAPIFWNADGIFGIQGNANSANGVSVNPVSYTTIQSFYNDIPAQSKKFARGAYNPLAQQIQWVYRSTEASTIEGNYEFDMVLVLNMLTGAFYPWRISTGPATVHGILVTDSAGGTLTEITVEDNSANTVIDNSSNTVITASITNAVIAPDFRYVASFPNGGSSDVTFADKSDETYYDWASLDATDYESYFITGYKIHAEAQRKFQTNFVYLYNQGTGTFQFRSLWDYSRTGSTGRWSVNQLIDYTDTNYTAARRRLKCRGQGEVLQFKVTSLTGEPFYILGWSTFETSNATP